MASFRVPWASYNSDQEIFINCVTLNMRSPTNVSAIFSMIAIHSQLIQHLSCRNWIVKIRKHFLSNSYSREMFCTYGTVPTVATKKRIGITRTPIPYLLKYLRITVLLVFRTGSRNANLLSSTPIRSLSTVLLTVCRIKKYW